MAIRKRRKKLAKRPPMTLRRALTIPMDKLTVKQAGKALGVLYAVLGMHLMRKLRLWDAERVQSSASVMADMYILASYMYYHHNEPLIDDASFDELAKRMLVMAKKPANKSIFKHGGVTTKDLKAGTYLGEYPTYIQFTGDYVHERC